MFSDYSILFIFGCAGSSLLGRLCSSCREWGLLLSCSVWVSHCGGISCCRAGAQECVLLLLLLLSRFSRVRLCDSIDSSPPGSPVSGILQARTLEWVAISFSNAGKWSRSVMSNSLRPQELYSPWNSPGQNTEVGSLSLIQGIFPTQRLNPGLPHCRWILYQLSHKGSPYFRLILAYLLSAVKALH